MENTRGPKTKKNTNIWIKKRLTTPKVQNNCRLKNLCHATWCIQFHQGSNSTSGLQFGINDPRIIFPVWHSPGVQPLRLEGFSWSIEICGWNGSCTQLIWQDTSAGLGHPVCTMDFLWCSKRLGPCNWWVLIDPMLECCGNATWKPSTTFGENDFRAQSSGRSAHILHYHWSLVTLVEMTARVQSTSQKNTICCFSNLLLPWNKLPDQIGAYWVATDLRSRSPHEKSPLGTPDHQKIANLRLKRMVRMRKPI